MLSTFVLLLVGLTVGMVQTKPPSLNKMKSNQPDQRRLCEICGVSFRRVPEYERHLAGNRHKDMLSRTVSPDVLWQEYVDSAPHWIHPDINISSLLPLWKMDELDTLNFRRREKTLHPSQTIGQLPPLERARLWRYIRDAMGYGYYKELANILVYADADPDGHIRVKELLESLESYSILANFIVAAQRTIEQNGLPRLERIVELACGHGLVGVLLAYRFRNLDVHLYDLSKRKTFDAFVRAFQAKGTLYPGDTQSLPNLHFHEEDLINSKPLIPNSVVVCLHGCGEVNEQAVELAMAHQASGWAVMPCCIEKDQYLDQCHVILSEDKARYNFLCGAYANKYKAQLIQAIDERITNRPLIIAGGVGMNGNSVLKTTNGETVDVVENLMSATIELSITENESDEDKKVKQAVTLAAAARRGNMPKLLLS